MILDDEYYVHHTGNTIPRVRDSIIWLLWVVVVFFLPHLKNNKKKIKTNCQCNFQHTNVYVCCFSLFLFETFFFPSSSFVCYYFIRYYCYCYLLNQTCSQFFSIDEMLNFIHHMHKHLTVFTTYTIHAHHRIHMYVTCHTIYEILLLLPIYFHCFFFFACVLTIR